MSFTATVCIARNKGRSCLYSNENGHMCNAKRFNQPTPEQIGLMGCTGYEERKDCRRIQNDPKEWRKGFGKKD